MSRVLPILFNTDMVRAILDGRKTVTRRLIRAQPHVYVDKMFSEGILKNPYQPEDILYARETWQYAYELDENEQIIEGTGRYIYAADNPNPSNNWVMPDGTHRDCMPWRPSIHMPKEAARIWLKVTNVRVERLQEIDGTGILSEGVDNGKSNPTMGIRWENMQREAFKTLWNSTIKQSDLDRYGWDTNPWVWVIEFERCEELK